MAIGSTSRPSSRLLLLLRLFFALVLLQVLPSECDAFAIHQQHQQRTVARQSPRLLLDERIVLTLSTRSSSGRRLRLRRRLSLLGVIRPESVDFDFNVGQGGVQLAQDSVIQLVGVVPTTTRQTAQAAQFTEDLVRYTRVRVVEEAAVAQSVWGTGTGTEVYQDPGSGTDQIIVQAPTDAVQQAVATILRNTNNNGLSSTPTQTHVAINFCGGDDAQVLEVMAAATQCVQSLLDHKSEIAGMKSDSSIEFSFRSLSHSSFPSGSSTVTVLAIQKQDPATDGTAASETTTAEERAMATGELYFCNGQYYTVVEEDINPAIA